MYILTLAFSLFLNAVETRFTLEVELVGFGKIVGIASGLRMFFICIPMSLANSKLSLVK